MNARDDTLPLLWLNIIKRPTSSVSDPHHPSGEAEGHPGHVRGGASSPLPVRGQRAGDRRWAGAGPTHAGNTRGHGGSLGEPGHH